MLVVRLALGVFWLREAIIKWHAGFGAADINLVVESTRTNDRVPGFYQYFTTHVLAAAPGLLGVVVPVLEATLGVLLFVGVTSRWVALISVGELASYWLADQLIWEYPIMLLLSAAVIAWPTSRQSRVVLGLRPWRAKRPGSAPHGEGEPARAPAGSSS